MQELCSQAEQQPEDAATLLRALATVIVEFNPATATSTGLSWASHERCRQQFEAALLEPVFRCATNLAMAAPLEATPPPHLSGVLSFEPLHHCFSGRVSLLHSLVATIVLALWRTLCVLAASGLGTPQSGDPGSYACTSARFRSGAVAREAAAVPSSERILLPLCCHWSRQQVRDSKRGKPSHLLGAVGICWGRSVLLELPKPAVLCALEPFRVMKRVPE